MYRKTKHLTIENNLYIIMDTEDVYVRKKYIL